MTFFDTRAALAKIENQGHPPASFASFASFSPSTPQKEAKEAKEATPRRQNPKNRHLMGEAHITRPEAETVSPYGQGVAGGLRTWTGRVVSLDEWRRLSDWDRHGSTGKVWNGLTRKWEPAP